jgi:prolipoprotein diacylglyceryltransferase
MYTSFASFTFHTFSLYLSFAILITIGIMAWRLHPDVPVRHTVDVGLAALVIGFLLARAEYVWLNWVVFAEDLSKITNMQTGGLDWHGAAIGGLLGTWAMARIRGVPFAAVLDVAAPALPVIAFAGWTACRAVGCAYGAEVQTLAFHPTWQVTETRDIFGIVAPRYDTHSFGQWLSWALVVTVAILWLRNTPQQRPERRFWWVWCVFAAGMLIIGTVRADFTPVWAGLRADQWLDAGVLLIGMVGIWQSRNHSPEPGTP